jgi:hypothetical protein
LVNDGVKEILMRKQLLAGAMAVALATGMTTSAMAFGHGSGGRGGGGFHSGGYGGLHSGGFRSSYGAMRGGNFAGVRGFSGYRHGAWGGRRFINGNGYGGYGPYYDDSGIDVGLGLLGLGVGLATGGYDNGYCSPYAYDPGYCGSSFTIGW